MVDNVKVFFRLSPYQLKQMSASEKQLRWISTLLDQRSTTHWSPIWQKRAAKLRKAFDCCDELGYDKGEVNTLRHHAGNRLLFTPVSMHESKQLIEMLLRSPGQKSGQIRQRP